MLAFSQLQWILLATSCYDWKEIIHNRPSSIFHVFTLSICSSKIRLNTPDILSSFNSGILPVNNNVTVDLTNNYFYNQYISTVNFLVFTNALHSLRVTPVYISVKQSKTQRQSIYCDVRTEKTPI